MRRLFGMLFLFLARCFCVLFVFSLVAAAEDLWTVGGDPQEPCAGKMVLAAVLWFALGVAAQLIADLLIPKGEAVPRARW